MEYEGYNWVLRALDVNTSFTVSIAQKGKTALTTGSNLASIWAMYGCPAILHSDNGSEFLGETQKMAKAWTDNDMKIIHGRPRHPQSQGMVERSHGPFKAALLAAMDDRGHNNWPALVPMVQGLLNNRVKRNRTRSPYQLVFGCSPRAGYTNNVLPPDVLKILRNENGVDAIHSIGLLATEDEVCAAVHKAQEAPLEYDAETEGLTHEGSVEEPGDVSTTHVPEERPKKRVRKPITYDPADWRKYDDPTTGKMKWVPSFIERASDSLSTIQRKRRHHKMLEGYCTRFNEVGDYRNTHRVAYFLKDNNMVGLKGLKGFTLQVRQNVLDALPRIAPVDVNAEAPEGPALTSARTDKDVSEHM